MYRKKSSSWCSWNERYWVSKIVAFYHHWTAVKSLCVPYLIEASHCCTCWRNHIVNKEEKSVLGTKMNAFADEKIELSNGQITWHEILLLVEITDARLRCFFHNHLLIDVSIKKKLKNRCTNKSIVRSKTQEENRNKTKLFILQCEEVRKNTLWYFFSLSSCLCRGEAIIWLSWVVFCAAAMLFLLYVVGPHYFWDLWTECHISKTFKDTCEIVLKIFYGNFSIDFSWPCRGLLRMNHNNDDDGCFQTSTVRNNSRKKRKIRRTRNFSTFNFSFVFQEVSGVNL